VLDTAKCSYVMKAYPPALWERSNATAEQLCISIITLGELHCSAKKSARRSPNLLAFELFTGRLEVQPLTAGAAAHHGHLRAELERLGPSADVCDMLTGAHLCTEDLPIPPTTCVTLRG
jgi:tRNA(fMet)-specific endonuclease VapC